MKRLYVVLAVVAFVAAIFVWWFFLKGEGAQEIILEKDPIGDVSVLSPDVLLSREASSDFSLIADEEPVVEGDRIKTGSEGRGLVALNSGTLTVIDYDTNFTVKGDEEKTNIELESGNLWARVEKVLGKGEYYEIETPNAVAVVRGTSFGFGFLAGISNLVVVEGVVSLIPKDPLSGERLLEKEIKVAAGDKATVGKDGAIKINSIGRADKGEWYVFNNPEEKIEETSPAEPTSGSPVENTTSDPAPGTPTNPPPPTPEIAPLIFQSVLPEKVNMNSSNPPIVTLRGSGFSKVTAVIIGRTTVPSSYVSIKSDTRIDLTLSVIQNPGIYDIGVADFLGRSASLKQVLTVEPPLPTEPSPNDPTPEIYYPYNPQ